MQSRTYTSTRRSTAPVSRQRWMPWVMLGGSLTIGFAFLIGVVVFLFIIYFSVGRIPQGVSVAGLPIGGETIESAAADLQQKFARQVVTLTDGARQWSLALSGLGVAFDAEGTVAAAQQTAPDTTVVPHFTVDLNQAQSGLFALSAQTNIPADVGEIGRAMDIPVILDRLRVDVSGELADGLLELNMFEVDPLPPASVTSYTGTTATHIVEAGQELGLIAREYNVSLSDVIQLNNLTNPDLLYVGQELTIPAAGIYEPTQADAPPAPTNTGRSILVSLSQQRIYAYEDGQLVHSHLVSTGLPDTPTVQGDYSIYVKYLADDMSGPGYYLPQVPYTMYFYQGYAIHGTYWHNSFGRPMSHGCVNLPTSEAQWFFNWASVGTPVRVIA